MVSANFSETMIFASGMRGANAASFAAAFLVIASMAMRGVVVVMQVFFPHWI